MYQTEIFKNEGNEKFDWETYFSSKYSEDIMAHIDPVRMITNLREHLKEDKFRLTFCLSKVMRDLLNGYEPTSPRILELGAATGFLTRWLIGKYGGTGVLVDKSAASFKKFEAIRDSVKSAITYLNVDLFHLDLEERFDLVCSFGLIEHFKDKKEVLAVHREYTVSDGMVVILVPLDSPLTRSFLEVHPELNLGYRELLTVKELKRLLEQNDLPVVKTAVSSGYSYDFVGAVCRKKSVK